MQADGCPPPTERVRFRPYRLGDVTSVVEMFDDAEARRWYHNHSTPEAARRWIEWNLDNYAVNGFGLWAIEKRSTGAFLGDCGLTYQMVGGRQHLEIGYHLQLRHRGRGYATEAATGCLTYAFDRLGADFVCSIVDPLNTASITVARRLHDESRSFVTDEGGTRLLFWTERPEPRSD